MKGSLTTLLLRLRLQRVQGFDQFESLQALASLRIGGKCEISQKLNDFSRNVSPCCWRSNQWLAIGVFVAESVTQGNKIFTTIYGLHSLAHLTKQNQDIRKMLQNLLSINISKPSVSFYSNLSPQSSCLIFLSILWNYKSWSKVVCVSKTRAPSQTFVCNSMFCE